MSQLLKITLFGAPTITLAEQPLTGLNTGKALALFTYLAANRQPHARDHLADLLWSEFNNQQARNNLRYLLPDLRNSDENLRRSFLTRAPYHRQLLDLVQTAGAGTAESTSNPS